MVLPANSLSQRKMSYFTYSFQDSINLKVVNLIIERENKNKEQIENQGWFSTNHNAVVIKINWKMGKSL